MIIQIDPNLLHKNLSNLTLNMTSKFNFILHVKLGFWATYRMLSISELIVALADTPMQAFWYLARIGAHLFGLSVNPLGLKHCR